MTGRLCLPKCLYSLCRHYGFSDVYRALLLPSMVQKGCFRNPICESTGRLIFIFFKNSDNRVHNSLGQIAGRSIMKSPPP